MLFPIIDQNLSDYIMVVSLCGSSSIKLAILSIYKNSLIVFMNFIGCCQFYNESIVYYIKSLIPLFFRETPPPDCADFLGHTFNIFVKGLERELYRQEQELTVSFGN